MNTPITSIDENPTTALTLPDLPYLVQTPSHEMSRGLYTFLAVAEGCMWMPAFGFENGARTDGWFSALLEGDEDAWQEIEADYEDAIFDSRIGVWTSRSLLCTLMERSLSTRPLTPASDHRHQRPYMNGCDGLAFRKAQLQSL